MDTALQKSLRNSLGPFGERWCIALPATYTEVPASRFLDGDFLLRHLRTVAAALGAPDLRAVASLWHKHYTGTLLIPVLSALTMAGAGLEATAANVNLGLDPSGLPRRILFRQPDPGITSRSGAGRSRDLQRFVLAAVRENHLSPLIDQLRGATGVPRRILWTNVANLMADLYDQLADHPPAARAAAEDREAILGSPVDLITGGPNPLHGLVRYEPAPGPGLPAQVRCRTACCQRYKIPGYQECYTCPRLTPEERAARLEAHRQK